ncbi:MAG: F0F1 ATP synthase subunit epsilon [Sphingomonadales bacterium]
MTGKVSFELVSPERLLMSAQVDMAVIPGSEGDFAVLAGHAPMISTVRPGVLEVHEQDGGEVVRIFVRGGFSEVALDRLTVLAEEAIMIADLDRAALEQHIQDAREDLEDARTDAERETAHAILDKFEEIRAALA